MNEEINAVVQMELPQRANVMVRKFNDKTIVIYDDHRWILNVLFYLKEKNYWGEKTPNIIYFDKHDDAAQPSKSMLKRVKRHLAGKISQRDFYSMVEFDMSYGDDDWVTTGMEFEFIKDVVCIGSKMNSNITNWNSNIYKTKLRKEHKGFCISHLISEIGYQGIIGDTERYNQDIRDIFGYKDGALIPDNPYVLDFDLDCFTTECRDYTYAWPEQIFWKEYVNHRDTKIFVDNVISNASIITICREPDCCGGIGESNKILSYLDGYFFNWALGTRPIE